MNAPPRSGSEFPAPGLTEAVRANLTGPAPATSATDPASSVATPPAVPSAGQRESGSPHPAPALHCRVKGCGRRIVRGRLGFLAWVHLDRSPFPHYARR